MFSDQMQSADPFDQAVTCWPLLITMSNRLAEYEAKDSLVALDIFIKIAMLLPLVCFWC